MTKRRRSYGPHRVAIDVDIDAGDVIAELSDDQIRAECAVRGIDVVGGLSDAEGWRDFAEELRSASGDRLHLEVLILRMLAMAGVPRLSIPKKEPVKAA